MRRILVENVAPRSLRHGGHVRVALDEALVSRSNRGGFLELDERLEQLSNVDPRAAELVKLRFFVGLTIDQAAEVLGVSARSPTCYGPMAGPGCERHQRELG